MSLPNIGQTKRERERERERMLKHKEREREREVEQEPKSRKEPNQAVALLTFLDRSPICRVHFV